jgi:hypothetical protein
MHVLNLGRRNVKPSVEHTDCMKIMKHGHFLLFINTKYNTNPVLRWKHEHLFLQVKIFVILL